jgi:hypothetical protein
MRWPNMAGFSHEDLSPLWLCMETLAPRPSEDEGSLSFRIT